jgi:hypothetical protein
MVCLQDLSRRACGLGDVIEAACFRPRGHPSGDYRGSLLPPRGVLRRPRPAGLDSLLSTLRLTFPSRRCAGLADAGKEEADLLSYQSLTVRYEYLAKTPGGGMRSARDSLLHQSSPGFSANGGSLPPALQGPRLHARSPNRLCFAYHKDCQCGELEAIKGFARTRSPASFSFPS